MPYDGMVPPIAARMRVQSLRSIISIGNLDASRSDMTYQFIVVPTLPMRDTGSIRPFAKDGVDKNVIMNGDSPM